MKPDQILNTAIEYSNKKASSSVIKLSILGFAAGAFIAFAAQGSNMASYSLFMDPNTLGLGKCLAGALFATGLILVIVAGGELFTGNCLMITGVLNKSIKTSAMLRNWLIVYAANFVGSIAIVLLIYYSGQLDSGAEMLGAATLKIAVTKVNLGFGKALVLGILCNWLVCLAVWMAWGAESIAGKILAIFFPIWLFITSGFEHSIANMYYVPIGLLIKSNDTFALLSGVPSEDLTSLTWSGFFINNLIPVTIGNIIGGMILVGMVYYYAYKKNAEKDN